MQASWMISAGEGRHVIPTKGHDVFGLCAQEIPGVSYSLELSGRFLLHNVGVDEIEDIFTPLAPFRGCLAPASVLALWVHSSAPLLKRGIWVSAQRVPNAEVPSVTFFGPVAYRLNGTAVRNDAYFEEGGAVSAATPEDYKPKLRLLPGSERINLRGTMVVPPEAWVAEANYPLYEAIRHCETRCASVVRWVELCIDDGSSLAAAQGVGGANVRIRKDGTVRVTCTLPHSNCCGVLWAAIYCEQEELQMEPYDAACCGSRGIALAGTGKCPRGQFAVRIVAHVAILPQFFCLQASDMAKRSPSEPRIPMDFIMWGEGGSAEPEEAVHNVGTKVEDLTNLKKAAPTHGRPQHVKEPKHPTEQQQRPISHQQHPISHHTSQQPASHPAAHHTSHLASQPAATHAVAASEWSEVSNRRRTRGGRERSRPR